MHEYSLYMQVVIRHLFMGCLSYNWITHCGGDVQRAFPTNNLSWIRNSICLSEHSSASGCIYLRDQSTQLYRVGDFVLERLANRYSKSLPTSGENFSDQGYGPNPDVDEGLYLATWLSSRAFSDSSTSIRPETFWMATEMARRT